MLNYLLFILGVTIPLGAMEDNQLDTGSKHTISEPDIPALCDTVVISESLVIVNCSHLAEDSSKLFQWPNIDNRVTTLDLSGLKLKHSEIIKNVNNLENLIHLNISDNLLVEVESLYKYSFKCLRYLDLKKNMLKKVPSCISGIQLLNLAANNINQLIIDRDIGECASLKKVNLAHNAIDQIGSLCRSESDPQKLPIRSETQIQFKSKLESLELSSNKIKYIKPCSFEIFTDLIYLNLSNNYLNQITEHEFKPLDNLEKLDLSFNALDYIDMNAFKALESLKFLDVSHNLLKVLPASLPMLDWLDASFNVITTLPETYTTVLYPQAVFLLGGNPFVCNCDLLWLKETFDTRKYLLNFRKEIDKAKFIPACESPDRLKGLSWIDIEDHMFQCEDINNKDTSVVKENVEQVLKGKDLVEASEVGKHFITLTWNIPADLCKFIEIRYHKFGHKKDSKEIILPSSVSNYRIKQLESGMPYVVCVKITLTNDLQDCIEVITKSETANQSLMYDISKFCHTMLSKCYSRFDVIILSIGLFTILYFVFLKEKDE